MERWVVEDVEMEEEEEKCSDQPKPFCWDVQVCLLFTHFGLICHQNRYLEG